MFMQFLFDSIRLHLRAIALTALLLFSLSWVFSISTVNPVDGPNLCHLIKTQNEKTPSVAALGSGNMSLAADIDHVDMDDKFYVSMALNVSSPFNLRASWQAFRLPSLMAPHYPLIDVPIV
jgi:hypothetical protein